jgi:hypothetical protein
MKTDWSNYTIAYNGINYSVNYRDNGDLVACENYVANSPTPKNPQPLISNLPAGTYKVADYKGDWWEFTLTEDLHGIGDVRDSVEFDRYSHNGRCLNNIVKKIFNGTESIVYTSNSPVNGTNTVAFAWTSTTVKMSQLPISTHFLGQNIWNMDREGVWVGGTQAIWLRIAKSRLVGWSDALTDTEKTNLFKAWLADQYNNDTPVSVVYQLATPTRTPITFTLNNSSTAPECPMEFLTDTPSLEYPAEVFDAGGEVKVENADGSKFVTAPIPALRSNADGTVYDEFEVKTGKLTRKIGRIESYNGEDVGDDWISSTGALDTGATVEYVLAEPIEEQHDPVTLPTYYPFTRIEQDGAVKGVIEATCKVME